jgi:hypothetical protein
VEDSRPYPGNVRKNNRTRDRAGRNTTSKNSSAREANNGPGKSNIEKRRANKDRDLEWIEGQDITDQGETTTSQARARDKRKVQPASNRGKQEANHTYRRHIQEIKITKNIARVYNHR